MVVPTSQRGTVHLYATEEEDGASDGASTDILNSPAFLTRKLDVLKSDIVNVEEKLAERNQALEVGKAEWASQIEDLQTEFLNFSSRLSKESESGNEQSTMDVAKKMLDVLDNFDRAFGVVTPETDRDKEIEAAYKNTNKMVLDIFASLGVKEVVTLGTEFDYEFHSAVMMRPSDEYEEGIVCEELAKGYMMESGKLIRAAMVSVAA